MMKKRGSKVLDLYSPVCHQAKCGEFIFKKADP